jgi:hypothetical protein
LIDAAEPTFGHLLLSAYGVQLHYLRIQGICEVCDGRVVEGKVAIFSDTEEA